VQAQYRAAHVHGALYCDLERDLSAHTDDASKGGRHPLPSIEAWANTLGRWGIDPQKPVLLYDDKSGSNAAARAWCMLRAAGHETSRSSTEVAGGTERRALIDAALVAIEANLYPVRAWQRPIVDIEEVAALCAIRSAADRRAPGGRGESEAIDRSRGTSPAHKPGNYR
jgi:thiosulfate/3-mercaptopyruvate sulfurtransferase